MAISLGDRLLIVGEDRGASEDRRPAAVLTGASGRRLASLAGISWIAYLRRTERVNVVGDPGQWRDRRVVARRANDVLELAGGRTVIVLGVRAWRALGLPDDAAICYPVTMYRTDPPTTFARNVAQARAVLEVLLSGRDRD